ncbi:MAG: DUF2207 domain-containing protein [Bacteroidales bacterium]|nr:DUF2207 domain-containing protein [Bacteroidales bacterium]
MKRFFAALTLTVVFLGLARPAAANVVNDLNITVNLQKNGTAVIKEVWDVDIDEGTEWYLVRSNLGDIRISSLQVSDENGRRFAFEQGEWDSNRSIEEKAFKCGVITKSGGCELCWGLGSHGHHCFTVVYAMTKTVKSLEDADIFHIQLVSPGLSSAPRHVKAVIGADQKLNHNINPNNSQAWGFGFEGSTTFLNGAVVFESTEPFRRNSSLIAFLRFDKGTFAPESKLDKSFQDVYDEAMEGADFGDEEDDSGIMMIIIGALMVLFSTLASRNRRGSGHNRRKLLGMKPKEVQWFRDIPCGGDVVVADYMLTLLGEKRKTNCLASAEILRRVYDGTLTVSKDAKERVELAFATPAYAGDDPVARELYAMMEEAAGSDRILQHKEFTKWSRRHNKRLYDFTRIIESTGISRLAINGWGTERKPTPEGQKAYRELLGFKKFLIEFTLNSEREVVEVALWRDYLVFGALFGIADKVAEQLKHIDPKAFEEAMRYDHSTMTSVLLTTNMLSSAITRAAVSGAPSSGRGGFGGSTSFGGGGGFSGGGFGGGAR